jgi:flagellar protein FliS
MQPSVRNDYLTTEVMTATPQKLQLMMIDAALRLAGQARLGWQEGNDETAHDALVRCQQIVTEMICGLNPEKDADLVRKVASVYLFVFRTLTTAQIERDEVKLTEAISILEVERETWQEVCNQLGTAPSSMQLAATPDSLPTSLEA